MQSNLNEALDSKYVKSFATYATACAKIEAHFVHHMDKLQYLVVQNKSGRYVPVIICNSRLADACGLLHPFFICGSAS